MSDPKRLLIATDVQQDYLRDRSVAAIRALARAKIIPCVRVGRRVYFDRTAIEAWIARGGTGLDAPRLENMPNGAVAGVGREATPRT